MDKCVQCRNAAISSRKCDVCGLKYCTYDWSRHKLDHHLICSKKISTRITLLCKLISSEEYRLVSNVNDIYRTILVRKDENIIKLNIVANDYFICGVCCKLLINTKFCYQIPCILKYGLYSCILKYGLYSYRCDECNEKNEVICSNHYRPIVKCRKKMLFRLTVHALMLELLCCTNLIPGDVITYIHKYMYMVKMAENTCH